MVRGELTTVTEIEAIVELGRIVTLGVLENCLEFVECFREPRLGRQRRLVLVPQRGDLILQIRGQGCEELEQVTTLGGGLACRSSKLLGGRNIATDRLPEIMHDADFDQSIEADVRKMWMNHQGHEAEAPSVLGDAFSVSGRCPTASRRRLERFGGAQKVEDSDDRRGRHLQQSGLLVQPGVTTEV